MKTNSIIYNSSRTLPNKKIDVKVRLNDACNNGHADFAITGTVYEKDKWGHWKWSTCGCCHDEIHKYFPKLRMFINLHLSDAIGAPMYAVENGLYHLRKDTKEVMMRSLRITEDEYNTFYNCAEDKLYFKYLLYTMGIVDRWKAEADQAIELLESLTGNKFVGDFPKSHIESLTLDEKNLIEQRISEGYYTPDNIQKRAQEAANSAKRKKIMELRNEAERKIAKIMEQLSVHLYIINSGLSISNFIYYDHKKEGVFNWMGHSYPDKITQEQFDDFVSRLDTSDLPEGITFKFGK